MTINSPTMSMKAVIIRIQSFLLAAGFFTRRSGGSFGRRLPERRRRDGTPHHASQGDDREQVRDHLDELRRDGLRALKLDLQRLGGGEQQTREPRAQRVPPPE